MSPLRLPFTWFGEIDCRKLSEHFASFCIVCEGCLFGCVIQPQRGLSAVDSDIRSPTTGGPTRFADSFVTRLVTPRFLRVSGVFGVRGNTEVRPSVVQCIAVDVVDFQTSSASCDQEVKVDRRACARSSTTHVKSAVTRTGQLPVVTSNEIDVCLVNDREGSIGKRHERRSIARNYWRTKLNEFWNLPVRLSELPSMAMNEFDRLAPDVANRRSRSFRDTGFLAASAMAIAIRNLREIILVEHSVPPDWVSSTRWLQPRGCFSLSQLYPISLNLRSF